MTNKFNRGFTLIELLVVIAIIGILSSVVLASLNTARGKGSDTAAKSTLSGMRGQAEIYYDTNGNYTAVCGDPNVIRAVAYARSTEGITPAWATTADNLVTSGCTNASGTYVMWVNLAKGSTPTNYWCVDNTGAAIQKTLAPATAAPTSCAATSAGAAW